MRESEPRFPEPRSPEPRSLAALVAAEAARPLPPPLAGLAAAVAAARGADALAVLVHGSCLRGPRSSQPATPLPDLYLLTRRRLRPASARRLMPPRPRLERHGESSALVAELPLAAFRRAMRPGAASPALWARFCQPAALAWVHDAECARAVQDGLAAAATAAAWWAERLSPAGTPADLAWTALFRRTLAAEIRADLDHADHVVAADRERWRRLARLTFTDAAAIERAEARRGWHWRLRLSRLAAALHLAGTAADGADHLVWRVERQTGLRLDLSGWRRSHPVLASLPPLLQLAWDLG